MKYVLLFVLAFTLVVFNNKGWSAPGPASIIFADTVPRGVPQLFGGKYYQFKGYVLVDSLLLMPCADTNFIPNKPAIVFKCTDSAFYFYNRQRWQQLITQADLTTITASNGLTKTIDDIQLGGALIEDTELDGTNAFGISMPNMTSFSFTAGTGVGTSTWSNIFTNTGSLTLRAHKGIGIDQSVNVGNTNGSVSFSTAGVISASALTLSIDTVNRLKVVGLLNASASGSDSVLVRESSTGQIKLKAQSGFGGGSVTTFAFTDGSGFDGTVTDATTTPTLALTTSLTTGSVPFIAASGALSENNSNFFWDNTNIRLGIGTASPARALHISLVDAATNSVTSMGRWTHGTSGTAAVGFGLNREINLENANGTDINAATEVFSWADATNGSEDATWTLNLVRGGSMAQAATISSLGALSIANSLVATGSATIGASNSYIFSGRSSINSSVNGDINLFNNAQNGFGRLNFGGTSSSFPALLRSSANLIVRLADNSANTDLEVLDEAYDATTWNGSSEVPTKNAIRDKIETLNIVQGTYTPTLTNGANVDASTVPGTTLYYNRQGNQVTVWGMVTIDPNTAAASTVLSISLPIASALTSYTQLSGQATGNIVAGAYFGGFIQGDDTNDRAQLDFTSGTTLNQTWSIRFTYEIL